MYEGRTAAKPGIIFGHENLGIVEEIGSGSYRHKSWRQGSNVFQYWLCHCRNCEEQYTGFCTNVNPGLMQEVHMANVSRRDYTWKDRQNIYMFLMLILM